MRNAWLCLKIFENKREKIFLFESNNIICMFNYFIFIMDKSEAFQYRDIKFIIEFLRCSIKKATFSTVPAAPRDIEDYEIGRKFFLCVRLRKRPLRALCPGLHNSVENLILFINNCLFFRLNIAYFQWLSFAPSYS